MKRFVVLSLLLFGATACGASSGVANSNGMAYPQRSASSAGDAVNIALEALLCADEFDIDDPYYVDGKKQKVGVLPERLLDDDKRIP